MCNHSFIIRIIYITIQIIQSLSALVDFRFAVEGDFGLFLDHSSILGGNLGLEEGDSSSQVQNFLLQCLHLSLMAQFRRFVGNVTHAGGTAGALEVFQWFCLTFGIRIGEVKLGIVH